MKENILSIKFVNTETRDICSSNAINKFENNFMPDKGRSAVVLELRSHTSILSTTPLNKGMEVTDDNHSASQPTLPFPTYKNSKQH